MVEGCFLKWWYPRNTPKWSFLVGKAHGCWVPPFSFENPLRMQSFNHQDSPRWYYMVLRRPGDCEKNFQFSNVTGNLGVSQWMISCFSSNWISYCWWFRNPKQPPWVYPLTIEKQWEFSPYCWWFRNPIPNHLGWKKTFSNNGINYQPQLVNAGFLPSTVLKSHFSNSLPNIVGDAKAPENRPSQRKVVSKETCSEVNSLLLSGRVMTNCPYFKENTFSRVSFWVCYIMLNFQGVCCLLSYITLENYTPRN